MYDVMVLFSLEALYWLHLVDKRQSFVRDGTLTRVLCYSFVGMIALMLQGEAVTIIFLVALPLFVTLAITAVMGWRLFKSWKEVLLRSSSF